MNENVKITVVTITYNSEKTLARTMESVITQNYSNLEYWIIDGNSKDRTMQIVKEYAKSYNFIHYISEPDYGISDAFNKGIANATGTLIGFINSDDYLYEDALHYVNRTYQETGADVIYGDTIAVDDKNNLKMVKYAKKLDQIKYESPFIHQSCFISKNAYEVCGYYNEAYKICMDYDMLCRIYHNGFRFAYTENILSVFQYGGTSCTHPIRTINENIKIAKKYGLCAIDAIPYRMKLISINIIKIVLSKLHLWGMLYKLLKPSCLNEA